jgi:hypothetical protein
MSGVPEAPPGRGWPRAAALFAVTLAVSVIQPSVLVAIPLVGLVLVMGGRQPGLLIVGVLAAVVGFGGAREGLWYVERGWGVLLGGWFAALSLRWPMARFSVRALGAVAGSVAAAAGLLALRADAWSAVDWALADRMRAGVATALELVSRDGQALSPALVAAVYQAVDVQATIFPAMLAIGSVTGLGVAWWAYVRLTQGSDQGLGPLKDFRFNDHLVWVLIGGLMLLMLHWGDAHARVGINAVVFMGLLYALRGAAVVMFVSSGLSVMGYVLVAFGLIFVPPAVLGAAMLIGIGDTWLDIRSRSQAVAT